MTFSEQGASPLTQLELILESADAQLTTANDWLGRMTATIAERDALIADLRAQLAAYTYVVPQGYTDITKLEPTGYWLKGLALIGAGQRAYLPEGQYEIDAWSKSANILVTIPKVAEGFKGAGSTKTVIIVRDRTSAYTAAEVLAGETNPLSVLQQTGGKLKEFGGFTLIVGDQGHNSHGVSLFNAAPGTLVDDVEIFGGEGDGGAPPRETFQFTMRGSGHHRLTRCAFHGGDTATVGLTFQNTVDTWAEDCTFTGHRASPFVAYQSFNSGTRRAKIDVPTLQATRVNTAILNVERGAGIEHYETTITGGVYKYNTHASLSNDKTNGVHYSLYFEGVTYSTDPASPNYKPCRIVDPISWPDWWNKKGTGKTETFTPTTLPADGYTAIVWDTWATYKAGPPPFYKYGPELTSVETVMQAPTVLINGQSALYDWNFGGKHRKIRAPYTEPAAV